MSETKSDLKYSQDHEWVRVEGNKAVVGITDYAQEELGEVVYIELPEVDEEFAQGDEISSIESVKAASPVINPLSGTVTEVNESLEDEPEALNSDPFGSWIYALEMEDSSQLDELMDEKAYKSYIESL